MEIRDIDDASVKASISEATHVNRFHMMVFVAALTAVFVVTSGVEDILFIEIILVVDV